jgi:predicted RNA-binding Zn-ribbon protein involved in translation (DUF1610 family)
MIIYFCPRCGEEATRPFISENDEEFVCPNCGVLSEKHFEYSDDQIVVDQYKAHYYNTVPVKDCITEDPGNLRHVPRGVSKEMADTNANYKPGDVK